MRIIKEILPARDVAAILHNSQRKDTEIVAVAVWALCADGVFGMVAPVSEPIGASLEFVDCRPGWKFAGYTYNAASTSKQIYESYAAFQEFATAFSGLNPELPGFKQAFQKLAETFAARVNDPEVLARLARLLEQQQTARA